MENSIYLALSRQVALRTNMDMVANNIANMNTDGFKNEQVLFEDVLERAGEAGRVAFVRDSGLIRDPAPGPIETTGNPLDLVAGITGQFQAPYREYVAMGALRVHLDRCPACGVEADTYRAIKAGGNYGEVFARNIGESTAIGLARGLNAQWNKGGLIYSPPFR